MPTRPRRTAWVAVTAAAAVMWTRLAASVPSTTSHDIIAPRLLANEYVYDGDTTYCWGVRANVSSSDVTDDLVFVRGAKSECPLKVHVEVADAPPVSTGRGVAVTWAVAAAPTADSALFPVKNSPALVDKRTRQPATIIHSNVHTCRFGSGCDAFRQGETETNATTNQVGNLSMTAVVSFATNEIVFLTPGKHVVLAHIIVPGPTFDTRYDFAVFTTIDVVVAVAVSANDKTVEGNASQQQQPIAGDGNATTSSSPAHTISKSQVIVLSAVGAFLVALLVVVAVYARRHNQSVFCFGKRDDTEDDLRIKGGNFCARGSNLRTRSSDWTELYAIDDMLPASVRMGDDSNAIAILRDSSRQSTPCSTPTVQTDRTVADFRHDVARWDERSSASPITPSSSAILIAAIQDPDLISRTPANDCFVPLESLVVSSPPAVCMRAPSLPLSPPRARWKRPFRSSSGRKRRRQQRPNEPPEDSGDEQEVDM